MRYSRLLLIFLVFAIITYYLSIESLPFFTKNNRNNRNNTVKENFLEGLFSHKTVETTSAKVNGRDEPLTYSQRGENKSMNDFIVKQNGMVDSDVVLETEQLPLSKLTPEQLEERDKIIKRIKDNLSKVSETSKMSDVKSNMDKKQMVNNSSVEKPKLKSDQCRFLSSQSCNEKYPVFMGASIKGSGSSGLVCNDEKEIVKPEAVAQIENGEVKSISIISAGKGFDSAPKVIIRGDRYTMVAKAIATVNKDGEVDSISVVSGGSGYVNTPKIIFEYDENNKGCFMCCHLDLFN